MMRWVTLLLVALVSFLAGALLVRGSRMQRGPDAPDELQTVIDYMRADYVDSLPLDSIYSLAASGTVRELGDPYSSFEKEEDYKALSEITTGNYGGLGLQIDVRGGWITVVAPLPQTPAERAGVLAGDQIIEVNGASTEGISQEKAVKTLRGPIGTKAVLKVARPGAAEAIKFSLTREQIHNRSVQPGILLDHQIGYVALSVVSDSSASELRAEVDTLLKQGMKGLIFDLRGNPGGLLTQGVAVSDLFLDRGRKIVETKGRMADMTHEFVDGGAQLWPNLPVIVLVNEFSASAAEIIAGALQDNDRAVVVGNPTFGKGLVQSFWSFNNGKGLKLTTGRWYTPSGRTIQRTAKDFNDQQQLASNEANRTDTRWLDSLPSFKTVSGRVVKGGGGIVPDRIVRLDTLSASDQGFVKAIGPSVSAFRDALVAEALDVKQHKGVTSADFAVTDQMRQSVVDRLKEQKVVLAPETVNLGRRILDQQLAYEIERYSFGRGSELRRRAEDDAQIRAALKLFSAGPTQAALLQQVAHGPSLQ